MYSGIDIKYKRRFWTDDHRRPAFINWWKGGGIGYRSRRVEEYKEHSGSKDGFFLSIKKS